MTCVLLRYVLMVALQTLLCLLKFVLVSRGSLMGVMGVMGVVGVDGGSSVPAWPVTANLELKARCIQRVSRLYLIHGRNVLNYRRM